jgi:hypothetical protein
MVFLMLISTDGTNHGIKECRRIFDAPARIAGACTGGQPMMHKLQLGVALLLIKVVLIAPVAGFALMGWRTCADAALSAASMVPVAGQLLEVTTLRSVNSMKPPGKKVAYTYRFGSREYRGDAGTFCSAVTTASQIDPLHEMYAQLALMAGKSVTVWVDPAQPEHAVLIKHVPRGAIVGLGVGMIFLVACVIKLELYVSRRLRRRFGAAPNAAA